jgi:hypothetical protein
MLVGGVAFLVGLAILVLLRDALPMIGHIEAATVIMALAASVIGFVAASEGPVAIRTGSRIALVLASAVLAVGIALQGTFGDDGEPLFGLIDPGWTFWWSHLAFMGSQRFSRSWQARRNGTGRPSAGCLSRSGPSRRWSSSRSGRGTRQSSGTTSMRRSSCWRRLARSELAQRWWV